MIRKDKSGLSLLALCFIVFFIAAMCADQANAADDFGDKIKDAARIKKKVSGSIEKRGDVDVFRVNLKKNRVYTISVDSKTELNLELTDDSNETLGIDDGFAGAEMPVVRRLSTDKETLYIFVTGRKAKNTGAYTLTVKGKRVKNAKPMPRADMGVAVRSADKSVLIFGGAHGGTFFGDLWRWNGTKWSYVDAQSGSDGTPAARSLHTMAYHAARDEVIMFGGRNNSGVLDDMWRYDGKKWRRIFATGPDGRAGARMVYDPTSEALLLFGGYEADDSYFNDLWKWDGQAWTQLWPTETSPANTGPENRGRHAMVYNRLENHLYVFGGMNGDLRSMSDLWLWDGEAWHQPEGWSWNRVGRVSVPMAFDTAENRVYMYGGYNGYKLNSNETFWVNLYFDTWNELWRFNLNRVWFPSTAKQPVARSGHAFVYDSLRQELLLFGGWDNGKLYNDTWVMRFNTWYKVN